MRTPGALSAISAAGGHRGRRRVESARACRPPPSCSRSLDAATRRRRRCRTAGWTRRRRPANDGGATRRHVRRGRVRRGTRETARHECCRQRGPRAGTRRGTERHRDEQEDHEGRALEQGHEAELPECRHGRAIQSVCRHRNTSPREKPRIREPVAGGREISSPADSCGRSS